MTPAEHERALQRAAELLALAPLVYPTVRPAALAHRGLTVAQAIAELDGPHEALFQEMIGDDLAALRTAGQGTGAHSPMLAEGLRPVARGRGRPPEAFSKRTDAAFAFLHLRALGARWGLCEALVESLLGVDPGELHRARDAASLVGSTPVTDDCRPDAMASFVWAKHRAEVLQRLRSLTEARTRAKASVFGHCAATPGLQVFLSASDKFGKSDRRARRWLRRTLCRLVPKSDPSRADHARRVHLLLSEPHAT